MANCVFRATNITAYGKQLQKLNEKVWFYKDYTIFNLILDNYI